MTVLARTKSCANCGAEFSERRKDTEVEWSKRTYCSISCANKSKSEKRPVSVRYWLHVVTRDGDQCWSWNGATNGHGYGLLNRGDGVPAKAHRVSWEIHFGPIPEGLGVLHKCDNPECSNPKHLFLGTQKDNARDMSNKGRMNPISYLNLRPGQKGVLGAGHQPTTELPNGLSQ